MADCTRAQLVNYILEHMGVKAAGEGASAEDAATAMGALDSVLAILRTTGKAPYDDDSIPAEYQVPMVQYVAGSLVDVFGIASDPNRYNSILGSAQRGYKAICALSAGRYNPSVRVKVRNY